MGNAEDVNTISLLPIIQKAILNLANQYSGKKEKPNNSGFYDSKFEEDLKLIGWRTGWPWCASLGRLIWLNAYHEIAILEPSLFSVAIAIEHYLRHSVIATYNAFKDANYEVGDEYIPGSLICLQTGITTGHMAILVEPIKDNLVRTFEGNTNKGGSRNGEYAMFRERRLDKDNKKCRFMGCIYPPVKLPE